MKTTLIIVILIFMIIHRNEARHFPRQSAARMARYIMHTTDWMSLATISTLDNSKGYAFSNLKSTSDGPDSQSSGIPYMLLTPLEFSAKDSEDDNRVGLMSSLAQTGQCQEMELDAQDPRCGRLLITGKLVKVQENTSEHAFAKKALISRHPAMEQWMSEDINPNHRFYIAKVNIEQIIVMYEIQGSQTVDVDEYMNVYED